MEPLSYPVPGNSPRPAPRPGRRRALGLVTAVCTAAAVLPLTLLSPSVHAAALPPACAPDPHDPNGVVCTYGAGDGDQTFDVPAGVPRVTVDATGAPGGDTAQWGKGGRGASVTGADILIPTGLTKLYVEVGGKGGDGISTGTTAVGGYNGGGDAMNVSGHGGGGGGASSVQTDPNSSCATTGQADDCRLVVAGGGGGGGGGWGGAGAGPGGAASSEYSGGGGAGGDFGVGGGGGGGGNRDADGAPGSTTAGGAGAPAVYNNLSNRGGTGGGPGPATAGGGGGGSYDGWGGGGGGNSGGGAPTDASGNLVTGANPGGPGHGGGTSKGGGGGGGFFGGGSGYGGGGGAGSSYAPEGSGAVASTDSTGTAGVTIRYTVPSPAPAFKAAPKKLPTATVGQEIEQTPVADVTGGTLPYTYAIDHIPPGLAFDGTTGVLSGRPTAPTPPDQPDGYAFTVHVADGGSQSADLIYTLPVATAPTTTAVVNVAPANPNDSDRLTVDVTVINGPDTSGVAVPGGDVTLTADGDNDDPIGTAPLSGDGTVSFTDLPPLPVGSHTLTAHYPGDALHSPSDSAAQPLTVTYSPVRTFITQPPPDGTVNTGYDTVFSPIRVNGGKAPYHYDIASGALPDGLRLNGGNGVISGVPTKEGTYTFTLRVSDSQDQPSTVSRQLTIRINPMTCATAPTAGKNVINGTTGNNVINGTTGNDIIFGKGGNDTINGNGGNDLICTTDGNDTINTGTGNDRIEAGNGNNIINTAAGDDIITTGTGNDIINAGTGHNTVNPGTGHNTVNGG
ncbi:putative Ig domain-containing protein [Kitasatospora sp. NPDC048540]|uniref:putative Ig domain-containing protein n=1 Tax=Kitasatospora sp. NPDC048540 TaxID=3155634 RepID=UPI0033E2B7BE